jgi:hypothetical protein
MTTPQPTEHVTARVPTPTKASAAKRATDDGWPSLSAVVVALLEGYVSGRFPLGRPAEAPPVEVPRWKLDLGKRAAEGESLRSLASEAGVSWPTVRRCRELYLASA